MGINASSRPSRENEESKAEVAVPIGKIGS